MKKIKKTYWRSAAVLLLTLVALTAPAAQAGPAVKLDILFMNHGPLQPVIKSIKEILTRRGLTGSAVWYDFETSAGRDFMRQKNLTGHIPLLIFINGSSEWRTDGRQVIFAGFPNGYGPYQFQGKWSLDDLDRLLGSLTAPEAKKGTRP